MENILRQLSDYQIQASKKGMSFSIDYYGTTQNDAEINVNVRYQYYSDNRNFTDARTMSCTFSPDMEPATITQNLNEINSFIQNVTVNLD